MKQQILDANNFGKRKPMQLSETAVGKTLAVLGAMWFLMMLCGCGEKEPPPTLAEQLEGSWVRTGGFIQNKYRFNDGALDVYTVFSSQIVYENNYIYTTQGETLRLLDLVDGTRAEFTVEFPTDSTAVLSPPFGLNIFIKRLNP
jgi:hypothetical protein